MCQRGHRDKKETQTPQEKPSRSICVFQKKMKKGKSHKKKTTEIIKRLKAAGVDQNLIEEVEDHLNDPGIDFKKLSTENTVAAVGIARNTLLKWGTAGCPSTLRGKSKFWNLGDVIKWKVKHEVERATDDGVFHTNEHDSTNARDWKSELVKVKTLTETLDYEEKRGTMITIEQHQDIVLSLADSVRREFESIGKALASRFFKLFKTDKIKVEKEINNEVEFRLEAIANQDAETESA